VNQYLVLNRPFVETLARTVQKLNVDPIVEVCAGGGALTEALRSGGLTVTATDAAPPTSAKSVETCSAAQALQQHQPRLVIGSFVPQNAGIDATVLNHPSVGFYLVLNASFNQRPVCQYCRADVKAYRLDALMRWMITRHDVWLDHDREPLTHGQAWLLAKPSEAIPALPEL
jgi:hypothetical protein